MPSLDKEHSAVILSPPSDLLQQPIFTNNNCAAVTGTQGFFNSWIHSATTQVTQVTQSLSGSAHRKSQISPVSGTSVGRTMRFTWQWGTLWSCACRALKMANAVCLLPGSGSKQYVILSNSSSMRDQLFHKSSHHYHHLQVFHSTTDPAFTAGKHALLAATCSKVVISGERPPCIQMIFSWELLQVAF